MSALNADSQRLLEAAFGTADKAWLISGRYDATDKLGDFREGQAGSFDLPDDRDLYYCVSTVDPARGRTAVERVYVLAIDDVGKEIDEIGFSFFPLVPSYRVESSKGSYQVGFFIDGGMEPEEYTRLRRAMASHPVWGKAHNKAPANIYRLPQGRHTKSTRGGWSVRLDSWTGVRYSVAQLWAALGQGQSPVSSRKLRGSTDDYIDDPALLGALLDLIPNDVKDWDLFVDVGRAVWGASSGLAYDAFETWAAKCPDADADVTQRRWESYHDAMIGRFWLLRKAREADPAGAEAWLKREAAAVFDDDAEVAVAAVGGAPNAKQLKYAQEVARRYGEVIRWNVDRGAWAVFGGGRWTQLEPGVKRAYQISVNMAEVAGARSKGDADVNTAQFHNGVEDLCRQWPALQVREKEFDVDPWLLGTPGGVVDLRTGVVRVGTASDMISKQTAVGPNSGGCPQWMKFLGEITGKDLASTLFLQAWAGYCLTGVTTEQVFLFVHGPGGNGKSVFADTLRCLWADYAVQPVGDLFVKKAHGLGHTSKLAMLAGARLCTVQEVPAGAQWDEGLLKDVTGGGAVTASFKHKNEFTFQPLFKLMALGNHQPTFPGGISPAIKRRFRMMEFGYVPKVVDPDLMAKFRGEWPGILRWAIDGALAWKSGGGLIVPDAVSDATKEFFEEQDLPGRWLAERVEKSKGSKVQTSDLFRDWIEWRNEQGNHTELDSQTAFSREMTERRGLVKLKLKAANMYQDIKLKSRAATAFDGE